MGERLFLQVNSPPYVVQQEVLDTVAIDVK